MSAPVVCNDLGKEKAAKTLTNLRGFLVRSRELESLALWLKEPLGQNTLILEVSSLCYFYAKYRDFLPGNFCTLCRILQVRVPIASLETVQKQCRNRALTLGQMKNDSFNHWLDGDLSDHKGKYDTRKEECPLVWGVLRGVGISAQAVNIISIMIIQIILRRSMGCNSFTAWFSKTTCW